MKKIHISFADESHKKSLELLKETSEKIGKVDTFIGYDEHWLKSTQFAKRNSFILNNPRGYGFWLWKSFIILETFKTMQYGDIVLYSDAGLKVIGNLNPLFEVAQNDPNGGIVLFKLPAVGVTAHKAKAWTRRDAFVLTDCDSEKYWHADMGNGAVSLWKKTDKNVAFVKEWLRYLKDPRIIMDGPNMAGQPNFIDFKDHRHDQSVLTILATKYNLELFRDPTQYGNEELDLFTNSPYPQLFHHHRNFKHIA